MSWDLRWVMVLVANLCLIVLSAEVNHYLAPLALHVYPGGVLLVFGILHLRLRQGLMANGITALVLDAINPLTFGYTFLLMVTCHVVLYSVRGQFARDSVKSNFLVALGLNLVLIIAFGIAASGGVPDASAFWGKIITDSTISVAVILLVLPWFLALQKAALASMGIDIDAELREAE